MILLPGFKWTSGILPTTWTCGLLFQSAKPSRAAEAESHHEMLPVAPRERGSGSALQDARRGGTAHIGLAELSSERAAHSVHCLAIGSAVSCGLPLHLGVR